ncbi:hypothetical protein HQQ80_19395 [Microbacteriaceae bacterium VKM Ac-2855]|nr:hypothetical protein [Microbacteriaceae bacterium VKM Ac-2855]
MSPRNSAATTALVFGVIALVLTPIPLFIGLILGGILAAVAVVFGVIGLLKGLARNGAGVARAVIGGGLGVLCYILMSFGAGTIW